MSITPTEVAIPVIVPPKLKVFAVPTVASRKYSPTEMIEVYQNAANGGRIGFNMGGGADMGAPQMNNAQVTEEAITKIIQKIRPLFFSSVSEMWQIWSTQI